ncbi:hypothetical protein C440_06757 [Haloferax mucosum ATCC BAA-1512]|uniref:Uncharacterized protein n=1 Tax=Haloferax mucosum ATCC BAA-1512 TaxID=662479 RepID=M0IGR4_9EURY|nr:hypothetical protein [Haloferax mucosum]ELZ95970.1 hypothetical protein C440_06757 [Haloferax mucosum ATCC BAA-1512]
MLKSLAAGGSAATVLSSGVTAAEQSKTPGGSLENKTVYTGGDVQLGVPSKRSVSAVESGVDVGLFAAETGESRKKQVQLLENGATLCFLGNNANDTLAELLTGIGRSNVASGFEDGDASSADDIDYSWGLEYDPKDGTYMAAVHPRGSKGVLDTHVYRRKTEESVGIADRESKDATRRMLSAVDRLLGKYDKNGNKVGVGTQELGGGFAPKCPGSSGWTCLGDSHVEDIHGKWGAYEKRVTGAVADGDHNRYFSFRVNQTISASKNNDNIDGHGKNDSMKRKIDFNNATLRKHGPETTPGSTTTSISVGIDSEGVANASWGWSSTSSNVRVVEDDMPTTESVRHKWKISKGSSPALHSVQGHPGYQAKTDLSTDTLRYDYKSVWWWYHLGGAISDNKKLTGSGNWSV